MEQPRHQLATLIDQVRDANGWSDTDIVRRATSAGHKLSKSNLSRIRNTDVVSVTSTTIRALTAGLGVPEPEVARAALASMGIDLPDFSGLDLETVVKIDPTLAVRDKQILLDLLRTLRDPGTTITTHEIRRRQQPGPPVRPVDRDVEREPPTFDLSRMLAAMEEPESTEPPDEPDVDAPSDDFEGR